MSNGEAASSRSGWGVVKLCCGGTVRAAKACRILISEARPDTQPVWPISDLTLPSWTRGSPAARAAKTSVSERNSTASPTGVAVAWASTTCMVSSERPLAA